MSVSACFLQHHSANDRIRLTHSTLRQAKGKHEFEK